MNRQFDPAAPNAAWVGDITEIATWEGKLYLATVIDLYSRRLLGFAIADNCTTPLVCDALKLAIATRGGKDRIAGVIMHTAPPGIMPINLGVSTQGVRFTVSTLCGIVAAAHFDSARVGPTRKAIATPTSIT